MTSRGYTPRHEREQVPIMDHIKALLDEREKRYQQRFEAQEKALSVAITSIDYRLSLLNELRSGVATESQVEALRTLYGDLSSRVKGIEARSGGVRDGLGYIIAAITIIGTVIAFVVTK